MVSCKWCICIVLVALFPAISAAARWRPEQEVSFSRRIVVDQSGQAGGFRTIQSAIDSVPATNQEWTRVDIKAGTYREQVMIPYYKPFIYLNGEGDGNTIIEWSGLDDNGAATFNTEADNILAKDITFINSYNINNSNPMGRAIAARILGNKTAFHRCGFISLQDTLWDVGGRHYFKECTIRGAVDFIYGAGQSIYEGCMISVASLNGTPGFITAQGRGSPQDTSGFVFKSCNIVGEGEGEGKALLGRAWREYARVVFYDTQMSDVIVPQGWDAWFNTGKENQLTMAEYDCSGPGATSSGRVSWEKKLSEGEVEQFTSISFIDDGGWVNQAVRLFG